MIGEIIERTPELGAATELVFVEGGSSDGTREEIERQIDLHPEREISLHVQTGVGKGDAVRLGFEKARNELLMILDADLTVAPEDLDKFYRAVAEGHADFANGSRLVYDLAVRSDAVPEPAREQVLLGGVQRPARAARQGHALRDEGAAQERLRGDRALTLVLRRLRSVRRLRSPARRRAQDDEDRRRSRAVSARAGTARRTSRASGTGCCSSRWPRWASAS